MRKTLLFLSVCFIVFIGIWAIFGKSSNEFIRDIKIIIFGLILIVNIISLIVIAIGEKDVVKYPVLAAFGTSLGSGFISGFLIFDRWILVFVFTILYSLPIFILQYKKKTFSNKIYKNDKKI
ncbi:putative membrane protein [Campylobacter blaseri]|uniref:Uncharacterized protein n=1 Tax=Campylobacter blaseri TaxID=2042961 RepID=A0A2P8R009_9BACT|nr:hypothetical protein [Campylobacter blaseri]PSM51841.1 hypothetical protein CQ405_06870 [Campylobacter blaseri]PSM53632.1 hypothetical protein CRN67_06875 [Campylobacter blaseri]QKF86447.1 putative membrane protein [Campylobacter blaseri]